MHRVLASLSPDDTVAALRLLKVLEECRQLDSTEPEAWRRRIQGWARRWSPTCTSQVTTESAVVGRILGDEPQEEGADSA